MIKRLLILIAVYLAILALNAYFLPTISQDMALSSVNSTLAEWRAYEKLSRFVHIFEFIGFVVLAGYVLLPRNKKNNNTK